MFEVVLKSFNLQFLKQILRKRIFWKKIFPNMVIGKKGFSSKIGINPQFIPKPENYHSTIETRRLKTVIIFIEKMYLLFKKIKKSLDHFSKDCISLSEHKKEENIIFFCQYSKHHHKLDHWCLKIEPIHFFHDL